MPELLGSNVKVYYPRKIYHHGKETYETEKYKKCHE